MLKLSSPLSVDSILRDLLDNQWITSNELANKRKPVPSKQTLHPITFVGGLELVHQKTIKPITEEILTSQLAQTAGFEHYHIDPLKVDVASTTETMSFEYAQRHDILVVDVKGQEMTVAVTDPFNLQWQDTIRQVSRRDINIVVANPSEIRRYAIEFYSLSKSIAGAKELKGGAGLGNFEQMLELGKKANPDANDEHVVNIVDWLLQYAFEQRASDIHVEPRRDMTQIRFRIDGVLHQVYDMPNQVAVAVISRIKILGRMNVAEKRKPQDGRLKTKNTEGHETELRLATMPTAFGEKMVMRVFDPEVLMRSFTDLGLGEEDFKRWDNMSQQTSGIVFVTGPTGSGKTTTLYSTLKHLATDKVNVCTLEDPIEMVEPAFNQMQIQPSIGITFAEGIKALMRQDPDIIMLGEIRDLETAQMAVQAALTGHLVLSTLHTNDAPTALTRLLDLGVPSYLLRSTILGVMAQRLVRTLCPHCKTKSTIDHKAWNDLVAPWQAPAPAVVYEPNGCLECRNTGFKGRAGLYEIFTMSDDLAFQIDDDFEHTEFRKLAIKEGMQSLRLSGAKKIAQGVTTLEEVIRVAPQSQRM